ncbi:Lipopolysaccharide core biosynthesis protein RfaG [Poriferisphaera corsica]|uniref:Lipopolysaccharide core biosynthesis protein RfaG n=1 Tax=Poriferisphaera corsica TaxID=2528020 RepID=A0A517YTD1_9BACT|nr:glycosyltransferase family 1 protein [Poriferisphaera corsica]QDU33486.1 Lipopolysaccharide core biosynthesis protein RfaG [Poriferisphaera corsica]
MHFGRYANSWLRKASQKDPNQMLIGLDARTIFAPEQRGIARSLVQMYRHLAQIRPNWHVIAYHREDSPLLPDNIPADWLDTRFIEMPGDRFDAWMKMRLPLAAVQDHVDVLHCPANICPKWMPVPTVVTIHDLIPIDMPHGQQPGLIKRFDQSVKHACQRADAITCPSNYTRDRLIADYHANPDLITTTHWSVTTDSTPISNQAQIKDKFGIASPNTILHFGAGEVRKNTRRLIKSWSMLPYNLQEQWQLIVVGLDFQTLYELKRYASSLNLGNSVLLYDFIDANDLTSLMHASDVLAYPSLSEGFGLPILEAFAANTAVITSDRTCLPEIASDAAAFVDPTDAQQMTQTLNAVMSNTKLRNQLIAKGNERLADFSWQQCAERFAQTIETIARSQDQNIAA